MKKSQQPEDPVPRPRRPRVRTLLSPEAQERALTLEIRQRTGQIIRRLALEYRRQLCAHVKTTAAAQAITQLSRDPDYKTLRSIDTFLVLLDIWELSLPAGREGQAASCTPNAIGKAAHAKLAEFEAGTPEKFIAETRSAMKAAVKFGLVERDDQHSNNRPARGSESLNELMANILEAIAIELIEGAVGDLDVQIGPKTGPREAS